MSPEGRHGPPWGWRLVQQINITQELGGLEGRVEFENPGEETVRYFRGQFYWRRPWMNKEKKVICYSPDWSLMPEEYALKLKQSQLVPDGV